MYQINKGYILLFIKVNLCLSFCMKVLEVISKEEIQMLTFLINNEGFIVRFKMREPRSSLLTLGKLAFGKAGIKPSCSAKISIIERNKIFNLEVL